MFRVRDGPIDWYFCDSNHNIKWRFWRQRFPISQMLKRSPYERNDYLEGKTIEEYILSSIKNGNVEDRCHVTDGGGDLVSCCLSVS